MAQWKGAWELSVRIQVGILKTHIKTYVLGQVCNPNTPLVRWETETRESLRGHGSTRWAYVAAVTKRPCLKEGGRIGLTLMVVF